MKIDKNIFNNEKSFNWMWEFSKRVVVAIFIIYIVNYILCWGAAVLCGMFAWSIPYIDTFVTATNETTQIVLGGYLIKSMAENVIKTKNKKDNKVKVVEESLSDNEDELNDDSSFDL